MNRYIDADKLRKDEIARCHCVPLVGSGDNNYKGLDEVLNEAPTADVVEVVRCKDCKHYNPKTNKYGYCYKVTFVSHSDDYCSRGERSENGKGNSN